MPPESQLAHRNIRDTNIPYISNQSPTVTESCYVKGSTDILTNINGYAQRRPGFADAVEATPTAFNNLQRVFTWDDFSNNFYVMANDISPSGQSKVYKMQLGLDSTFVLIFTDSGSSNPFDFVVSNSIVYFGNSHVMQKWNPAIGVENWGIAVGSLNNITGPNTAGAAASAGVGAPWVNPNNITTVSTSYATVTLPSGSVGSSVASVTVTNGGSGYVPPLIISFIGGGGSGAKATGSISGGVITAVHVTSGGSGYTSAPTIDINGHAGSGGGFAGTVSMASGTVLNSSQALQGSSFGFGLPSTSQITGILVSMKISATLSGGVATLSCPVQLINSGATIGSPESAMVPLDGSFHTVSLGSISDLWGSTLFSSLINGSGFGFQITPAITVVSGTPSIAIQVNSFQITVYSIGGPAVSVSGAAGSFSATVGYEYVFTYGNSLTGHVSSPTPVSASTGVFTNKLNVQISLTASNDPQVNQIHVYRTTDSAGVGVVGGTFFEIPTSPYPNTTANVTDNVPDIQLNIFSIAPTPTFNDPPPPSQGFVYFSGRIWMFVGNLVWFTGLEEIFNGVPEECVPSGLAGNFWKFDQPVQGLGVAGTGNNQTLLIYCGGRIYGISGQSLDTFQRFLISNRRGCRSKTTITMLGGMCAWLDSANQIWATDGNNLSELSVPIRPDLAAINPANCSMTFHTANSFHWLVFSTGTVLLIYDVDMEQWMPPWSLAAKYVFSGEIAPGSYQLMASIGTKALQLNAAKFNDNGATYQPVGRTNLFSLVPDFGRRFSYIAAGVYDEPSRTGYPVYVEVDTNQTTLADVAFITDEDPTLGTYTSLTNLITVQTAYNRTPGRFIQQNVYGTTQPSARWFGIQWKMASADQLDKVYGWFIAYKNLGGR